MLSTIRNKIAPHQAKGRWYRFFIESDGTKGKLTESPMKNAALTSNILKCDPNFHIVDTKLDVHFIASYTLTFTLRYYADGSQGIPVPAAANFDYAYVYVFGYYD